MSADNGIFIRKHNEKYEVRHYFASFDYPDIEDMSLLDTKDTIEEAIKRGQEEQTEYGLTFDTDSFFDSLT
jgi:hypothetical protein